MYVSFKYCISGVGILFKKKKPPPPNLFSFLAPLSVDVWIYIVTAYLLSSILLFVLGRYECYFTFVFWPITLQFI